MRPGINAITLAVADLEAALAFYREGLGLATDGIIGTQFAGDDGQAAGDVVMFTLDDGLVLALYPAGELAKDAHVSRTEVDGHGFSIGHFVESREAVDALLEAAAAAGGRVTAPAHERPWGIYSGYFRDLDGHLWEIIHALNAG
ncbi:MAG: VOC family protein [Conexibacteraceae bacterium]|nr:VOC family protein [Conexibacteraceae bacterium]